MLESISLDPIKLDCRTCVSKKVCNHREEANEFFNFLRKAWKDYDMENKKIPFKAYIDCRYYNRSVEIW